MIDEIRIRRLREWPDEAVTELHDHIRQQVDTDDVSLARREDTIEVAIKAEWGTLQRERLKHDLAKLLHEAERRHNLVADLESVNHVDQADVEEASFE